MEGESAVFARRLHLLDMDTHHVLPMDPHNFRGCPMIKDQPEVAGIALRREEGGLIHSPCTEECLQAAPLRLPHLLGFVQSAVLLLVIADLGLRYTIREV